MVSCPCYSVLLQINNSEHTPNSSMYFLYQSSAINFTKYGVISVINHNEFFFEDSTLMFNVTIKIFVKAITALHSLYK